MSNRVIVIGAGFGGIAAALRMRARGNEVTLVDRLPMLGGRARVFHRGGYVFDAGPTVLTAPYLFEELFALFNRRMEDYVSVVPLDLWYRFHFHDGTIFDYTQSLDRTLEQIRTFEPADVDGYHRMVQFCEKIFDVAYTKLADQPFHNIGSLFTYAPTLLKLRSYRSVFDFVSSFLKSDYLRRAFTIQPLLVGGNPFTTTSIYVLIHYLERKWGVHFAMGGTGALVAGLRRLMEEEGIHIRTETTVRRITTLGGRVTGVELEGDETVPATTVISNADPGWIYQNCLPKTDRTLMPRAKAGSLRYSMGLFVNYFGSPVQYHDVPHHTILMGKTYRRALRQIFDYGVLPDDLNVYLHRPTATDPGLAPQGHDNFYALTPVPNKNFKLNWKEEGERLNDRVLQFLDDRILPGIANHHQETFFITPDYFESELLSMHGSGFNIQPLFRQSAWFRYHNRSSSYRNLYFVGAGTHPGAGLPGVLNSAKVLERLID